MAIAITEQVILSLVEKLSPKFKIEPTDSFKIGNDCENIKGWSKEGELAIKAHCNKSNFCYSSRYIQFRTPINGVFDQFHYGYYCAYDEAYIYLDAKRSFLKTRKGQVFKFLCESNEIKELGLFPVDDTDSKYFRKNFEGSTIDSLSELFQDFINLFNPIIQRWVEKQEEVIEMITSDVSLFEDAKAIEQSKPLWFNPAVSICDIPYKALSIPNYQRTYKWGRRQINQLINDVLEFQVEYGENQDARYHIGTLVLHVNKDNHLDIVDGQQRMVSLSLIFYFLLREPETRLYAKQHFPDFFNSIAGFLERTKYDNSTAIQNLSQNFDAIRERTSDLDIDFFKTLMGKCQVAIVQLLDQSQAFQFFDSQNSRGKDLEPHDLLKAYHLREVPLNEEQTTKYKDDIRDWQCIKTQKLANLFLCLYRIKTWAKGNSAKCFTKDNTSEFKGISLKKFKGDKQKKDEQFPSYTTIFLLSEYLKQFDSCHKFYLNYKNPIVDTMENDFPFQIENNIVNGLGFFDFALYYNTLYDMITHKESFESGPLCCPTAVEIIDLLSTYKGRGRTGDGYVRDAFNALLLYYIDKFGVFQLSKAVEKIFVWCYCIRLHHSSVFLATVDRECRGDSSLFKILRDATTPYEFLNAYCELDTMYEENGKELYEKFDDLGKIKRL